MNLVKVLETRIADVEIPEKGIFRYKMKEGIEVELNDVIELSRLVLQIAGNKAFCTLVIVDGSQISSTPEAREYSAKHTYNGLRLAHAIVQNSLPVRLMANFFMKFNRPSYPVKIFSNEQEAIKWLRTFLPQ